MKTCVALLAMVAACAAMPHPGPPGPPAPAPGPMPHAPPMPTDMAKGGASDLKGEESLYLASPYSAYSLPYSAYNYNIRTIPSPSLGYANAGYGNLGYSFGYQYGSPYYY